MKIAVSVLKWMNRLFPPVLHPFNLQTNGEMSYAEWQYNKGKETIRYFLTIHSPDTMFRKKTVLDIGCGAGGKTIFYASLGATRMIGLEILEKYREEANNLAKKYHMESIFEFQSGDASNMPFQENTFDTIIMNDAIEHVSDPPSVLNECYRILKPGGFLYINFPPYYHPFGAHLSDAIHIPWVHVLFSESTLIEAYQDLLSDRPDRAERIDFRFSKNDDGHYKMTYINRMTIHRFKTIIQQLRFHQVYYYEDPLRQFLKPVYQAPFFKEWLTKMVVCILQKPAIFPTV